MGELTEKEKAQKYDEAIRRAKISLGCCDSASTTTKNLVYDILPELKESEDELTWLTKYIEEEVYILSMDIRDNEDRIKLKNLRKSLAWLKKQCYTKKDVDDAYLKGISDAKNELEKQVEHKPTVWSKDDEAMFQSCTGAILAADYYLYEDKKDMEAWLESLKNRVRPQIKEWSEEDKKRIDSICNFVWKNRKGDTDEIYQQEQDVNWLKSLKNRVKPQPNQWWSEEDEHNLNGIIDEIRANQNEGPSCDIKTYNRFLDWLKSIKDRVQPQHNQAWSEEDDAYKLFAISAVEDYYDEENPLQKAIVDWLKSLKDRVSWKPSKEQMDALLGVMVESGFNYIDYNILESLYNDLKKL